MKFLEDYNIKINNKKLLDIALTHTSYENEHKNIGNYERLEFLGDAVLELIISEYFYLHTNLEEGDMTKKRASFVCESALNYYADKIGLNKYIKVGNGQLDNINETITADVFESIIAVIYLDQGLDVVKEFIEKIIIPEIKSDKRFFSDYKTMLQEYMQMSKKTVEYNLVSEKGMPHDKEFVVEVIVDNIIYGKGSGKSKKQAEQMAAKDAYDKSVK